MKKNRKHGRTTAASTVMLPLSRDVFSMRNRLLSSCPGEGFVKEVLEDSNMNVLVMIFPNRERLG